MWILIGLVLTPLGLLGQYAAAVGYLFLFGGLMAGLGEPLIKALRRQLSRVPYPAAVAALDVVPAALGARAGAIGAALLEQSP